MDIMIKQALNCLKEKMVETFGIETEILLFGSAARGDFDEFSDVDVLILVPGKVDISVEERIFDLAFEVGLKYDIVFGIIVYSLDFWKTPSAMVMPLYESIKEEGIYI